MVPATGVSHRALAGTGVEMVLGHLAVGAIILLVASEAMASEDISSKYCLFFFSKSWFVFRSCVGFLVKKMRSMC